MSRTLVRMLTATLLAALLMAFYPASAGERELPGWFWFMPFNGTPHAIRVRFNGLAAKWADEGKFANWADPPRAQRAETTENDGFVFYNRDPSQPMIAGPLQYRMEGCTDGLGKVSELDVWIAPSTGADRSYLSGCEQLAQVATLSLFDELSEKASRSVLLALLYDLRPFNYRDPAPLALKERALSTVVNGTRVALSWSMMEHSQMRLRANLQGPATGDEAAAARLNNSCNRLLSQVSVECGAVQSYLRAMSDQRASGAPDWTELNAIAAQARSSLATLAALRADLASYEKTAEYALELGKILERERDAASALQVALDAGDASALDVALASAASLAADAHGLIGMIRK